MKKVKLPNKELEHLYLVEKLSLKTIGEKYGVSADTVRRELSKQGIKIRSFKEIGKIRKNASLKCLLNELKNRGYDIKEEKDRDKLIAKLYSDGLSFSDIAKLANLNPSAIYYILKKSNVKARDRYEATRAKCKIDIPKDKLEELYDSGLSHDKIGKIFNTSFTTIFKRMKEYHIPSRHPKHFKITKEELEDLYINQEYSYEEIAELYGVNEGRIRYRMKKYGLPSRAEKFNKTHIVTDRTREKLSELLTKHFETHDAPMKGRHLSEATKRQIRRRWNASPNLLETEVGLILSQMYPNEWKFNGDYRNGITIAGLVPDFINVNGKKLLIEVFGDIWHDPEKALKGMKVPYNRTEKGRKKIFSEYGFDCVILWEHSLKSGSMIEYIKQEVNKYYD